MLQHSNVRKHFPYLFCSPTPSSSKAMELRAEGNYLCTELETQVYTISGCVVEISPIILQAKQFYLKALEFSSTSEERAFIYIDLGHLFLLWARIHMIQALDTYTRGRETYDSCTQWMLMAMEYYYKAVLEGGEALVGKKLLWDILYWAVGSAHCCWWEHSFVKAICKYFDLRPPCLVAFKANLVRIDFMLEEGFSLLSEYNEKQADADYRLCLESWKNECEQRLERLQSFAHFYEVLEFFISRQHVFRFLVSYIKPSFATFYMIGFARNRVSSALSNSADFEQLPPPIIKMDIGSIYFGLARWKMRLETRFSVPSELYKQWAIKAAQYYYKAVAEGLNIANNLFLEMVYWAAQNYASLERQPSLLETIFNFINERPPGKVACYAYLIWVDVMLKQGIALLRKRHKEKYCKDSSYFQSWKAECEQALEGLPPLSSFLDNPEVFMMRKDLFQHLVNCIMLPFPLSLSHYSPPFAALLGVANAHLRYSLRGTNRGTYKVPLELIENAYGYKYIGKAFFYLARCELRVSHNEQGKLKRSEEVLNCLKVQMSKVLHYYYKAMSEENIQMMSDFAYYRQIKMRNFVYSRKIMLEEETERLLFAIVDWAAQDHSPTLLKVVCKSMEVEGADLVPSSNAYSQHLVAFSYANLKLLDGLLNRGIAHLEEYMERSDGEFVMDYNGSLIKKCVKALERLSTLNGSLQNPHDLKGRIDLLHLLLNVFHSNTKHEVMEKLETLMGNNQEIETLGATLNPRAIKTLVTLTREHRARAILEEKRKREEEEIEREFLQKLKERRKRDEAKATREILIKLEEKRRLEEKVEREILMNLEKKRRILKMEADRGVESYLSFLYKEHPHPNPNRKLGSISNPMETKEALRMAILHYHPDSNIKHGREWVMLCNEVTKFLNNKYMNYT